ncbi:MAG: dATP pyrophosphohydrolase, partial [Rhodospirillaceae bacterium]
IPLTEADAKHMANKFKMILIPELVWFAFYEGKPAAMAVALPDLNEMIRDLGGTLWPMGWMKLAWRVLTRRTWSSGTRVPLMGVAPRFKNKPLGSVLGFMVMDAIRRESLKLNMPVCEMSWVLEDNTQTRHSLETIGGRVYKTYRMYEKAL